MERPSKIRIRQAETSNLNRKLYFWNKNVGSAVLKFFPVLYKIESIN